MMLPASPWMTQADNVCMMRLPNDWRNFLTLLPNSHIFSSDVAGSMAIVTFICEDKVQNRKAVLRQLIMGLCSGQNQRRALGFEDSYIFGAIVNGGKMQIFVSEWIGDAVVSSHSLELPFRP